MKTVFTATLVVGLSLAIWAFWLEPASLRVSDYHLKIPNWPEACAPLRVAVLADLHVGSPFNDINNLRRIVEETQHSKPDLILLPGDFVIDDVFGGTFVAPEAAAKILGNLDAALGMYAVLGNHDWWLDPERVQTSLEAENISVMEDRSVKVIHGECVFYLVGLSDYWEGPHDVKKALSSVPDDTAVLLFIHNPDVFPELPDQVTLTIAGHTHGGQVYVPWIGRPVVPSRFEERFAQGHVVENGRHLFVSSGIGTSIMPVRFLVPPEISLLVLGHGVALPGTLPSRKQ